MDTRTLPNRDRLTAKEVAEYLGVCLDQVYDLNKSGVLPAVPHGARSWRWKRDTVLAFDRTPMPAKSVPSDLTALVRQEVASAMRLVAEQLSKGAAA